MEARISIITLGVADLDRARAFYEKMFGWQPTANLPEIAFYDLGGLIFSLYPHDSLAKDYGGEVKLSPYKGFALAHNLRSIQQVDACFDELKAKEARIIKEPEPTFWGGYSGYISDLDGHVWEIAYNPFWTILGDGSIVMQPCEEQG
ncbi:MAG: VOC family protein [Pseudomonadota bacterium]